MAKQNKDMNRSTSNTREKSNSSSQSRIIEKESSGAQEQR